MKCQQNNTGSGTVEFRMQQGSELNEMATSDNTSEVNVYAGHKDLLQSYSIELRQRKANDALGLLTLVVCNLVLCN